MQKNKTGRIVVMKEKKIKLLIFDLDSTLAPIGKGMGEEELQAFRAIDSLGIPIVVASGKTCDYLCGFLRQIGLREPIMIGENGAVIRFGVDLPPKQYYRVPFSKEATKSLKKIKEILEERFPHIWFQPNKIGVTPFPTTEKEFCQIEAILEDYKDVLKDVVIYRHVDSFDIVPAGIDKATGISYLLERMEISPKEIVAVGDGVNDYSMFALAGFSVGVEVKEEWRVDVNCKTTMEMLQFMTEYIEKYNTKAVI